MIGEITVRTELDQAKADLETTRREVRRIRQALTEVVDAFDAEAWGSHWTNRLMRAAQICRWTVGNTTEQ
jgi:hypothetical protein